MNDTKTIATMKLHGDTFEKALAHACELANPVNLWIIKGSFPELWEEYNKMAEKREYASQYTTRQYTEEEKRSPFGYSQEPPEEERPEVIV